MESVILGICKGTEYVFGSLKGSYGSALCNITEKGSYVFFLKNLENFQSPLGRRMDTYFVEANCFYLIPNFGV